MLLQRQQKAFGSRLAVEIAMNATLGRRAGIHSIVQAGAVRLKDVKVMDDGFHGDLLVFQSFCGTAVRANSLNLTGIGDKAFTTGAADNRRNMIFFKADNFHGDLLNQLVNSFIKQTKNNQITNDVVSKQVHRLGQLVHATKLVGGGNIIGNGVVLFHNILHKRINHLDSISQQHRMIRSNPC